MDGLTLRAEELGALTPEILDRVAQGEAVDITRGGSVVAAPRRSAEERAKIRAAIKKMAENREKLRQMGVTFTQEEIRAIRDDHGSE